MATHADDAKGSKDGGPTNPEVQDDALVNSKKSTKAGKRESDARKGFRQASGTPLPPAEDFDEDQSEAKDPEKLGKKKSS